MSAIYNWDIFCVTEGIHYYQWSPTEPTVCPNDSGHTIQTPVIIGTIEENATKIIDDTSGTNGFYKCLTYDINIPGVVGVYEYSTTSPPYPVRAQTTNLWICNENKEDYVEMQEFPYTLVGVLTANALSGATTFTVSTGTLSYIYPGFNVYIGGQFVGVCTSKNVSANTITTSIALGSDVNAGGTVHMTKVRIENMRLCAEGKLTLGTKFEGGVVVNPNTPIKVLYNNVDGVAKRFSFFFEIYY